MTVTSIGYDGPIDEVGFAQMMPSVGASEYGVVGSGDWKVTAHPSTAQAVNVAVGKGWGHGVFDTSDAIVTVQCAAISSGTRWDLIAARRNWQPVSGTTSFGAISGGITKALPGRLTQPGSQDDQPIALVQWTAGQTQPTAIVDLRIWAGNGGVAANDDLVRTYLTSVGTEVNIGGSVWVLRLGANDVATWEKVSESGRVPMFGVGGALAGGNPPSGTQFLEQEGTFLGRTDESGFCRLTYPAAFPNGLLSIQGFSGDSDANGPGTTFESAGAAVGNAFGQSGLGSKSDWVYRMVSASGTILPNKTHRINWRAKGW